MFVSISATSNVRLIVSIVYDVSIWSSYFNWLDSDLESSFPCQLSAISNDIYPIDRNMLGGNHMRQRMTYFHQLPKMGITDCNYLTQT